MIVEGEAARMGLLEEKGTGCAAWSWRPSAPNILLYSSKCLEGKFSAVHIQDLA